MHTVRAIRVAAVARAGDSHSIAIATFDLAVGLMKARAESLSLYHKIKTSHRGISGPHLHQYRALLQAHAEELLAASHALDERIRDLRGTDTAVEFGINLQSSNNDGIEYVTPEDLLVQLRVDNQMLAGSLRSAQASCQRGDIVTESLIDVWIDEARRRAALLTAVTWDD